MSRPARGAWIEIDGVDDVCDLSRGRAPQGARGLKCKNPLEGKQAKRRAPQGARGLKSHFHALIGADIESRPARGAWIEIHSRIFISQYAHVAPRKGRVD